MATGKKLYWFKMKKDFLSSDTVDYFMSLPNGANYVVLYQAICLLTLNTGGRLSRQIGNMSISYDAEKISRETKWFTPDFVREALELYKAVGLVGADKNGILFVVGHRNLIGQETDYAEQKRNQKEAKEQEEQLESARDKVEETPVDGSVDTSVEGYVEDGVENFHTDIRVRVRDRNTPPIIPPTGGKGPKKAGQSSQIEFPFTGVLGEAVKEWLEYKKEKRQGYKPAGVKALFTQIGNKAREFGDSAVADVIRESMACGYQGIVFDRIGRGKPQTGGRTDDGFERRDF